MQSCECAEVIEKLDNMQDEDGIEFEWLSESPPFKRVQKSWRLLSSSLNPDDSFLTRSHWQQYRSARHQTHIWRIKGCFVSERKSVITVLPFHVWWYDVLTKCSTVSITNGGGSGGPRSVEPAAAIGRITKRFCFTHMPSAWFCYFLVFDLEKTRLAIRTMWQEHVFCVSVHCYTAGFQCQNRPLYLLHVLRHNLQFL